MRVARMTCSELPEPDFDFVPLVEGFPRRGHHEKSAVAEAAIARFRDRLHNAHVDTIRDDTGRVVLSEVELIEPTLFLDSVPGSAERFVRAVERRASPYR